MLAIIFALAAPVTPFAILGEGNTTCGQWLDSRREQPGRVLPEAAWMLGYVTAIGSVEAEAFPGRDIAKGANGSAVDHWTDNYCAVHPLDHISEAARALVIELVARSKSNSN